MKLAASFPDPTFMYRWAIYIPRIGLPILLHECGNWEIGRAVSFLGIHKSDLLCSVLFLSIFLLLFPLKDIDWYWSCHYQLVLFPLFLISYTFCSFQCYWTKNIYLKEDNPNIPVKEGGYGVIEGGGPQTDKHLPQSPFTDKETGPPRWEASTLEKSHSNSLCCRFSDPLRSLCCTPLNQLASTITCKTKWFLNCFLYIKI